MFTKNSYRMREDAMLRSANYRKFFPANNTNEGSSTEIDKYYTFDEKGHIMVVTTSKDTDNIQPAVAETFQKVIVFFGAWTAALNRAGKTLFDYDAVTKIIGSSGFFISTGKEVRKFSSESTTASLDTSIIQGVIGGGITGGGLGIAKRVLANIGTTITASFAAEGVEKEICHLMFICESLMGMPIVTVSLYHTHLKQHAWVTTTNCSSVSRQTISFDFAADDYLFVDPTFINKFSAAFQGSKEYDELIDKLAGYLKS